jgi:hypothetical protein
MNSKLARAFLALFVIATSLPVFVRAYGRTEKIQAAHWNGIVWQWLDLRTP